MKYHGGSGKNTLKERPHYAAWQNATKCSFATQQMPKIVWTSMRCGFVVVSACCSMLQNAAQCENLIGKMSVSSKVCHTNIYRQLKWDVIFVMMRTCFLSTVFVNWNTIGKKLFFSVDEINFAAFAEQLLQCGKATSYCMA